MLSRKRLDELLSRTDGHPVLSVYLNTDPAQDPTASYRIWLKDALKSLEQRIEGNHRKRFEAATEEITSAVRDRRAQAKSWIAFASDEMLQTFDLRTPVENEVQWGHPELSQLEWILNEFHPYGVLLVDSQRLRPFVVSVNEIVEFEEHTLELDTSEWREKAMMPPSQSRGSPVRGAIGGGSRRDEYADRVKTQTERFWKETLPSLREIREAHGVNELVVAGPKAMADRFVATLGPESPQVIGQLPMSIDATPSDVLAATLPIIQDHERTREQALVEELLQRASTSSQAGVGLAASLKVLQEGRASRIVVNRRLDQPLHECESCGYVFEGERTSCPSCSADSIRETNLRAMLPILIRRHGAEVTIIRRPAADRLQPHGGIGAFWRY